MFVSKYLLILIAISYIEATYSKLAGNCWVRVSSRDTTLRGSCNGKYVKIKDLRLCRNKSKSAPSPITSTDGEVNDCVTNHIAGDREPARLLIEKKERCRLVCDEDDMEKLNNDRHREYYNWAKASENVEVSTSTTVVSSSVTSPIVVKPVITTPISATLSSLPTTIDVELTTLPISTPAVTLPVSLPVETTLKTTETVAETSEESTDPSDSTNTSEETKQSSAEDKSSSVEITKTTRNLLAVSTGSDGNKGKTTLPIKATESPDNEREVNENEPGNESDDDDYSSQNSVYDGASDLPQVNDAIDEIYMVGDSVNGVLAKGVNTISTSPYSLEYFFITVEKDWEVFCSSTCSKLIIPFKFLSKEDYIKDARKGIEVARKTAKTKKAKDLIEEDTKRLNNYENNIEQEPSNQERKIEKDEPEEVHTSEDYNDMVPASDVKLNEEGNVKGPSPGRMSEKGKEKIRKKRSVEPESNHDWEFVDENDRLVKIVTDPDSEMITRRSRNNNTDKGGVGGLILVKLEQPSKDMNVVIITKKKKSSQLKLSKTYMEGQCKSSGDHLIRNTINFELPEIPEKNYLICTNGTVIDLRTGVLEGIPGCTMVYIKDTLVQCLSKDTSNKFCKIVNYNQEKGDSVGVATISTGEKSKIHLSTRGFSGEYDCDFECRVKLPAKEFLLLTCKKGSDYRTISAPVELECAFSKYYYINNAATRVCREVKNASLFWWLVGWFFGGLLLCLFIMYFLSALVLIFTRIFLCIRLKSGYLNRTCAVCHGLIGYESELENHVNCNDSICPYCRNYQGTVNDLRRHVLDCPKKSIIEERSQSEMQNASQTKRNMTKFSSFLVNWSFIKLVWAIVLIILVVLNVAVPVVGQENKESNKKVENYYKLNSHVSHEDTYEPDWMEEMSESLERCGTSCFSDGTSCKCPGKKQANQNPKKGYILSKLTRLGEDSGLVPMPDGFYDVNSTFTPSDNMDIISMEINTERNVGNNIQVTGQSISQVPLSPRSGIIWNISHPDASEHRIISFSIYEYAQIYSVTHKHWVVNRIVNDHKQVACTGHRCGTCNCGDKQGCAFVTWNDDRNWYCNPMDCLVINGGCTCCSVFASIHNPYLKRMLRLVEAKYMHTEMIICIMIEKPKRMCRKVKDIDRFTVENFEVQIGEIFGEFDKLPKRMIELYEFEEGKINLEDPEEIYLNPDICIYPSCRHGLLGDSIIYDENPFVEQHGRKILQHPRTQMAGISISHTCKTGYGPTCVFQNVVTSVDGQIDDLKNIAEKITSKNSVLYYDKKLLKIRPNGKGGIFTLTLKANNLPLARLEDKVEVNNFKITHCSGCRSCTNGFHCTFTISIKYPSRHIIHLQSTSDGIAVDQHGFVAEQSAREYNTSLFTVEDISEVTLRVKETGTESTLSGIKLKEPAIALNPPGYTYVSVKPKEPEVNNGDFFGKFWKGIKGLWSAGWSFALWIFGSWWRILIYILLAFLFIILFTSSARYAVYSLFHRCCSRKEKLTRDDLERMISEKKNYMKENIKEKANKARNKLNDMYERRKKKKGGHFE